MEPAVEQRLLKAEEFWVQYGAHEARVELVRGEIIEMPPPSFEHGAIQSYVVADLVNYVRAKQLGEVLTECDFRLDEDTVRRPDVAFVAKERLALIADRSKFAPIPPDIAVEVVSPTEQVGDIRAKIRDYLRSGTKLVWVIYPDAREVVVHYPDGNAQTLGVDDTLSGGGVLPGFVLPIAQLFPAEQG